MVLKLTLNCLMFSEENTNAVLSNSISNFLKDSTCNIEVEKLNNKSSKLTSAQNMNIKNKIRKKNRRKKNKVKKRSKRARRKEEKLKFQPNRDKL